MRACAVLVDAENVPYSRLDPVLKTLESMGYKATVRRAYGDFRKPCLKPWNDTLFKFSFKKVSAPSYVPKKGTSDMAMIIGAMDMLHTAPTLGVFVLVTSDSDFTPLVRRLKESGKEVLGFGENKAPLALVFAKRKSNSEQHLVDDLAELINQICHEDDGYASLSVVGQHFDCKRHGYSKILARTAMAGRLLRDWNETSTCIMMDLVACTAVLGTTATGFI